MTSTTLPNTTTPQTPPTTNARPHENNGTMIGRAISATLSPESRRRSNIFGILHADANGVDAVSSNHFGSPSAPSPARMSVASLVDREADQGMNGVEGMQGKVSPLTFRTMEDRLLGDVTRQRSVSPSKEDRDRRSSIQSNGTVPEPQAVEERGLPSSFDQGIVEMEIDSERREQDHNDEQSEHEHQNGDAPQDNFVSSGEEDEGQIEGAIEADPSGDDNEDDEEDSNSDTDEDEDDEGSIDLDQEDVGDSPVFISMRNGPLGISDLLLPPAAADGEVRVKAEPGQEDLVQSQAASSDVVVLGSRAASQERMNGNAGGAMDVVAAEDSQRASINGIVSAENQPSAVAGPSVGDASVNVLVAKPKRKRVRAKSPSPPPAPPPKPRVTIRVVFNLFDEEEGPDGKSTRDVGADGANDQGSSGSTRTDTNGDVPMPSTSRNESEALPSSEKTSTPKPADPPAPREEPKFRVVNFKQASIAQGKVDSDYYVINSGWNAMETDDDDDEGNDMDIDGEADRAKASKKKFNSLLTNGASGSTSAIPTPAGGDSSAQPGILQAMMGDADETELARLAEELDKKYNAPTTSKPKRKRVVEDKTNDYDYQDPFIDDSDLKLDEPMITHRPAKEGFYVQNGAVELINDEEEGTSKKAKSKKQTTLNFGKLPVNEPPPDPDAKLGDQPKKRKKVIGQFGLGYRPHKLATPQSVSARPALGQSDSGKVSHRSAGPSISRDSASTPSRAEGNARQSSPEVAVIADPASGVVGPPPAPVPPIGPPQTKEEALARLPEEIRPVLLDLSNMSESLSDLEWRKIREAKKFPDSFKPLVHAVGRKAIDLGIVGDALFDAMPFLIRYNRFTMKKYIVDKLRDYQVEHYRKVKEELFSTLKNEIVNTMERQVTDYNAQKQIYDSMVKDEQESARNEGREQVEPTVQPPTRRMRWSEVMRRTLWQLSKAADDESRFQTHQAEVHEGHPSTSAITLKSQLYAEIVPLFPDEWMSSQQLSRQLSSLRTRYGG